MVNDLRNSSSKAPVVGIHLGRAYSCVGVVQHGKVKIIANDHGNRITPSCVAFTNNEILVGESAKSQMALNPKNTIFDAIRLIGRKFNDSTLQADMKNWPFKVVDVDRAKVQVQYKQEIKTFFPEEISSIVLAKMKETAETYLGKRITDVVITVPAYFNDGQSQATKNAGLMAGLNVIRIINESTASAVTYGLDKKFESERRILIFNLGASSIDLTVLFVEEGIFEVISSAEYSQINANDIDDTIYKHFITKFENKYKKDNFCEKHSLKGCELTKRALLSNANFLFNIDSFEGCELCTGFTSQEIDEICKDFISEIVENFLNKVKLGKQDIHEIVVAGESCRFKSIVKILTEVFISAELNANINPKEVVACGAATVASYFTISHEAPRSLIIL